METKIQNNHYFNPGLKEDLKISLNELEAEVKQSSSELARIDLPRENGDKINLYFSKFHSKVQSLIDKVNFELQSRTTVATVVEHGKSTKSAVQDEIARLSDKKSEGIKLNSILSQKPQNVSFQRLLFIHGIIILVGCAEGAFALPIFQSWGYSLIEAMIMAVLYSIVITAFSHLSTKIINLGKTLTQRRIIASIMTVFVIGFFTYLANTRVQSIKDNAKVQGVILELSPIPFVLMATFVLVVAIALSYFYMPTKKEKEKIREIKMLESKNTQLQNEIKAGEKAITNKQDEHFSLKALHASKLECGATLEDYLTHNAHYLFQLFISENQKLRDISCDCYNDEYTLQFKYYFKPILTKSVSHYEN